MLNQDGKGIVYLVGAGPGDPGLLTLKGWQCLEAAEVVVYDRLLSESLLDYAPDNAVKVDVGKIPGQHQVTQEAINRLLVDYGQAGKRVVRLKGGDPFLFGRGGEEALALVEAGVAFEIVPGVTSAIAVPAYAGIPVTHRGSAVGVTIITGHEMEGKDKAGVDWAAIGNSGDNTLVILMGISNLKLIVAQLLQHGFDPSTPAAVIENGTTSRQRIVRDVLSGLVQLAEVTGCEAPAVIVVGRVVELQPKLKWQPGKLPLCGKKVLITRPLEQSEP